MPRSVVAAAKKEQQPASTSSLKPMTFVAAGEKNGGSAGGKEANGDQAGKSNSDFRKMLLGQK